MFYELTYKTASGHKGSEKVETLSEASMRFNAIAGLAIYDYVALTSEDGHLIHAKGEPPASLSKRGKAAAKVDD